MLDETSDLGSGTRKELFSSSSTRSKSKAKESKLQEDSVFGICLISCVSFSEDCCEKKLSRSTQDGGNADDAAGVKVDRDADDVK